MAGFDTKEKNQYGEYEICFQTKDRDEFLAVQEFCRAILDKKLPVLQCKDCKYYDDYFCCLFRYRTPINGFCSLGEKNIDKATE